MENYKKEKCSKQHLKIDLGQNQEQDIFMLANPMTFGDVTSPTSPQSHTHSSRKTVTSNPNTPTGTHQGGFTRSADRWSLKSRTKNQSIFKIFGRSSSGGGSGGVASGGGANGAPCKDEEDASSGSEQEDPFSPHSSVGAGDLVQTHRHMSEPPKSPPSHTEQHSTLPRQSRGPGHSSRDSGFSSERESISHLTYDNAISHESNEEDVRVSPTDSDDFRPAGMEALEILHNQLQLLVKRDSDEDTDSVNIYEQMIANLSKQLEEQSVAVDTLQQSETNLKLSLRFSQQRATEAEMKLVYAAERCLQTERKYATMAAKYKSLRRRYLEEETAHHKHSQTWERRRHPLLSSRSSLQSSGSSHQQHTHNTTTPQHSDRIAPQRVQSQTLYDRGNKLEKNGTPIKRPSTAQGFHDEDDIVASITSLSHTETSV